MKRAVVKFRKDTIVITFIGDGCTVKHVQRKKQSESWKKLVSGYRRSSNGGRKMR